MLQSKLYFITNLKCSQIFFRVYFLAKKYSRRFLPIKLVDVSAERVRLNHDGQACVPIFQKRALLAEKEGTYALVLMGQHVPLSAALNWLVPHIQQDRLLYLFNLHYMEYVESLPDPIFSDIVAHWVDQVIPSNKALISVAWHPYVISLRTVVWMQQLAKRHGTLSISLQDKMKASLVLQMNYLMHNLELDVLGNHLIKNIKALLFSGAFFNTKESKVWRAKGLKHLTRQLKSQILSDGMHFELSVAYHSQVFVDLLEIYALGDVDVNILLSPYLPRMAQVLSNLMHPDEMIAQFGDGGLHMSYSPAEVLSVYQRLFDQPLEKPITFTLPEAGYYGAHTESTTLIIDGGRIAPNYLVAHGHGDIQSIELSLFGERVFVDQGVFSYTGEERAISRATQSHNTITLNDNDQADFFGSFRVGWRPKAPTVTQHHGSAALFDCTVSHSAYRRMAGNPECERRLSLMEDTLEIIDAVSAGAGQSVLAGFLLHPSVRVNLCDEGVILETKCATITLHISVPIRIESAEWYPDFGVKEATSRLVLDYGVAPVSQRLSLTWKRKA